MKKVLFLLLAFMATVAVTAQQVSRQQALQKAQQFMPGKQFGQAKSFARGDSPTDMEPFYIFNAKGQKGFVIVSGDDRTEPILGYSDKGEVTEKNMPENLKYWLECYEIQMKSLDQTKAAGSRGTTRTASKTAVAPLIQAHWDQGAPYNYMCPSVINVVQGGQSKVAYIDYGKPGYDANNRCITGCVATAMAQVMYYWKWPETCGPLNQINKGIWIKQEIIEDPEAIGEEPVVQYVVDNDCGLPETKFDWENMLPTYLGDESEESASAMAVSKLMRYCGQAVNMNYGISESGTNVSASDMVNYFGYGKTAKTVYRMSYTVADWEDLIYNELFNDRPVLYGGSSASGGHQFICDGYDGNGLFHFNWGWSGSSDGYFVLSLANPQDLGSGGGTNTDGFSYVQDAIIGLQKPVGEEMEIPDIYGQVYDYDEWSTPYNRSSVTDNFTGVSIPGVFYMRYYFLGNDNIWPDYTVDYAWGLYQEGMLVAVFGITDSVILTDENWYSEILTTIDMGAGLADGTYMLRQVYRPHGTDDWILCKMPVMQNQENGSIYGVNYINVTISGLKLTLRKAGEDYFSTNITVNEEDVSFSPSPIEAGKAVEVTVNLMNNGDAFQEPIYFWYPTGKYDNNDNPIYDMTLVCGSVEPGQTGTVKLHFVPNMNIRGKIPVMISTDIEGSDVVWLGTITVEAPKPQSLSGTITIDKYDVETRVLSGNKLSVRAQITNQGTNTYDNQIMLIIYKYIEGEEYHNSFASTSVNANIQPGETKEVVLAVPNLNFEDQYFFYLYYYSEGNRKKMEVNGTGLLFTLTPLLGDADGSGSVDTDDVKIMVNYIMGKNPPGFVFGNADMNNDGKVDAVDLVKLINALPK